MVYTKIKYCYRIVNIGKCMRKKTIRVQLLLLQLQKEIFQTLEDGLKDHCNWFLSHCSAKVCDFFSNTTNPERGKEKENHFGC